MNSELAPVIILLSALVSLAVLYWIIEAAVSSATKKQHQQLVIQNRLLTEQLRRDGISEDRLTDLLNTRKVLDKPERESV